MSNDNRSPVWRPDGRQVAFLVVGTGVATLAADGSTPTPQPLRAGTLIPEAWSAAGELILSRTNGDIVATPDTPAGDVREVVAPGSAEFDIDVFDAALSPDGRWLAYVSNRTGQDEVWVQGYPDSVPVRVSSSGGHEPLWSADGRELFYRQGDLVVAVALETGAEISFGAPQPLFSGPYVQRTSSGARAYDVARDGRFLMILPNDDSVAVAPASIVVVENFGAEIEQRVRTQ
jgi:Tol biopolymer transport system component